jgi:hypothetical protein
MTRRGDARVDENLAVRSSEDGDIAARTLQHRDVPAETVNSDRRLCCRGADAIDDVSGLRENFAGCQPASGGRERCAA